MSDKYHTQWYSQLFDFIDRMIEKFPNSVREPDPELIKLADELVKDVDPDIYEWGFPEPSHLVDIERIYNELCCSGQVAIAQIAYLENLRAKAPVVYGRLKEWAKENKKIQWWKDFFVGQKELYRGIQS